VCVCVCVAASLSDVIKNKTGFDVIEAGIGRDDVHEVSDVNP
jgi:hypothetical protein